jgi:MAP/microtubule affinity-regulating kinase
MSTDCETLLKKFLVLNPTRRAALESIMKDKWMNINYENDELKPYEEPNPDFNDTLRIDTIIRDSAYTREQIIDSLTSRKYDDIMAFYLLLAMRTNENDTSSEVQLGSTTKGVTDASNTPSSLASKIVSSSTRPSTTNDKENLPSIDKQHRPTTAAGPSSTMNDHSLTNGVNNSLLTSSSIDASTANNGQHSLLKTSASGGPPVSSMLTSNRTNTADKIRSQTVRLPGSGVRRRETIDPVPGGASMRKVDTSEKSKTPTGDA